MTHRRESSEATEGHHGQSDARHLQFAVTDATPAGRTDSFLADASGLSRAHIQSLIWEGCVTRNAKPLTSPSHKIAPGDIFTLTVPPPAPVDTVAQDIPLDILFEDKHLLVVNKPAGLVVHPAPGHSDGTLVNALLHHCTDLGGIGGEQRPGIVHRLDRDTTGVMVVAKTQDAMDKLMRQFQEGDVRKEYVALVHGIPTPPSGRIETMMGRSPANRKLRSVLLNGGRIAITNYRTLQTFPNTDTALLSVHIETGRTHQIRVHMKHLGHPVLFDPFYGSPKKDNALMAMLTTPPPPTESPRQLLHAQTLAFRHPTTRKALTFSAPLPHDFETFRALL